MRPIKIKLKPHDKGKLKEVVSKGSAKARTINRCRILILSSEGRTPRFIMEAIGCALKTIQNVKERYLSGGIDIAINDAPRSGAPTKFDGKARAKITALACSKAPDGHAKWSLHLLADKAVELRLVEEISPAHIGRILKKTK